MKVTCANPGIRKLFFSELLAGHVKVILILFLRFITKGRLSVGAFPYLLLGFGIAVALIRLPALRLAGYDEPAFRNARKAGIAELVLCFLNFVLFVPCRALIAFPVFAELGASVLVTIFIISGIMNIAIALKDKATAERGHKLRTFIFSLTISNTLMMLLSPLLLILLSTHVLPERVITNYPLIYAPLFLALLVEWVLPLCYLKQAEKLTENEIRKPTESVKLRPMA